MNEFGIELGFGLPPVRISGEVSKVSGALSIAMAIVVYVLLARAAYGAVRVPPPVGSASSGEMQAQMWSISVLIGGVFGFPGLLMASLLLAPGRTAYAPLVGAGVGAIHYLLGFGLLYIVFWSYDALLLPAGIAFSVAGWTWALLPRLLSRRSRQRLAVP